MAERENTSQFTHHFILCDVKVRRECVHALEEEMNEPKSTFCLQTNNLYF